MYTVIHIIMETHDNKRKKHVLFYVMVYRTDSQEMVSLIISTHDYLSIYMSSNDDDDKYERFLLFSFVSILFVLPPQVRNAFVFILFNIYELKYIFTIIIIIMPYYIILYYNYIVTLCYVMLSVVVVEVTQNGLVIQGKPRKKKALGVLPHSVKMNSCFNLFIKII